MTATSSFAAPKTTKTDSPHRDTFCADRLPSVAQTSPPEVVRTVAQGTDEQREEAIRQASLDMQAAYWRYETSNGLDIGDLGEAHRHRIRMTELIRGRSPEYVARLERERGLT